MVEHQENEGGNNLAVILLDDICLLSLLAPIPKTISLGGERRKLSKLYCHSLWFQV